MFGGAAARAAAAWFALGFGVGLLSGRVPYDLGFAIGLGSVLALMAGRTGVALGLAVVTSMASPVAGAFLALAGVADALAAGRRGAGDGDRRLSAGPRPGLTIAAAALAPIVVLALAFPEGGWEPFAPSVFWPALGGVVLIGLLLPQGPLTRRERRVVRLGAALYALALIGSFALHTPVGSNSARLGALLAGPLLAGVLWDRHRLILCLLFPLLLYWQIETPINDEIALAGDPSVQAAYYAPLRAELRGLTHGKRTIVEVQARDQIGLLYRLAKAIFDFGFDITFARIGTERGVAIDTFYIESANHEPIEDPERLRGLRAALTEVITPVQAPVA